MSNDNAATTVLETLKSLPVGTVINGRHGRWTLLGTPYASHPSTRDGSPVYRAMALWEGKGGPKTVTLTFAASDVYGRGEAGCAR